MHKVSTVNVRSGIAQAVASGGELASFCKERVQDYCSAGTQEGDWAQDRSGRGLRKVSVFLGRPCSHFTERAEREGGSVPTHLASQCPKQGGEAAQAADGFVHM